MAEQSERKTPYTIEGNTYPGLIKMAEETSGLGVVIAKIIGAGGELTYFDGTDLAVALEDEIADTLAAIHFFLRYNPNLLDHDRINDRINDRIMTKFHTFANWRPECTVT